MQDSTFQIFQPYIIGAIFGVVGVYLAGFVKEFFDERARKAKHKRDIASQVIHICNEASTGNFKKTPRNIENIHNVLTDLEGIDNKMCESMDKFVSEWQIFAKGQNFRLVSNDRDKFINDGLESIEEYRRELINWANTIRAGN